MSKAEKRHFKLYAQTGKKSPPKYVKLFDLINKQEAYDEQATRENGFKSDDKNLLMEKLLDSAHVMQLHKSADNELRLLLDYFSILEKKTIGNYWVNTLKKPSNLQRKMSDSMCCWTSSNVNSV